MSDRGVAGGGPERRIEAMKEEKYVCDGSFGWIAPALRCVLSASGTELGMASVT